MRCPRNPARRVPCSDLSHHSVDAGVPIKCQSSTWLSLNDTAEGARNRRRLQGPEVGTADRGASVKSLHGRTPVTAGQQQDAPAETASRPESPDSLVSAP